MRLAPLVALISVCTLMATVRAGYVLQGSMVQYPGKAPTMMQTGSTFMNLRDVPHSGFAVVGDQPLILLTVHVVDKDKPLYEWVN